MYFPEDENFARRLQYEEQAYESFKRQKEDTEKENLNPVAPLLEYIDPTPNIHDLFVKFDKKFFWNKLGMVQVSWSKRMTQCAGVCSFEKRGGLCKIALSSPLLSLRPRKDLVETLLHEMIHAYLFVTRNYKDRDDHGPEFHKHMFRINKEAGTKITVYHTFIDEVHYYQRHVWRCNGPCQNRKPYFGFLRRAMNRAPGPNDPWWNQHKEECGGTYIKISEPEKSVKKSKKIVVGKPGEKHKDIRDYFSRVGTSKTFAGSNSSNIKTLADVKDRTMGGVKTNMGTGTVVLTNVKKGKKSETKASGQNPAKTKRKGSVGEDSKKESLTTDENSNKTKDVDVRATVRNIWANKFQKTNTPAADTSQKNTNSPTNTSPKKAKLHCPICDEGFSEDEIENHVDKCLQNKECDTDNKSSTMETSVCDEIDEYKECPVCSQKILQRDMNDHLEGCLKCSFVNEDATTEDEVLCDSVPCPCCYKWFTESEMSGHIDECLTLNTLKQEILVP